jgi:hypothetical protein
LSISLPPPTSTKKKPGWRSQIACCLVLVSDFDDGSSSDDDDWPAPAPAPAPAPSSAAAVSAQNLFSASTSTHATSQYVSGAAAEDVPGPLSIALPPAERPGPPESSPSSEKDDLFATCLTTPATTAAGLELAASGARADAAADRPPLSLTVLDLHAGASALDLYAGVSIVPTTVAASPSATSSCSEPLPQFEEHVADARLRRRQQRASRRCQQRRRREQYERNTQPALTSLVSSLSSP